eukprot:jgi/Chrzof1/11206/Cz05g28010.t1
MCRMAQTAVVTGASGYIATELVKQLLEKGYNVRGTVRSLASKEKVEHLQRLAEALPGNLELFEADLLKEGSFDAAVEGATYVFHTASPYLSPDKIQDGMKEVVEPALGGTTNVFSSVAKHRDTIKRVVITSSIAAIRGRTEPALKDNKRAYNESDWNETSTAEQEPYPYSKVQCAADC